MSINIIKTLREESGLTQQQLGTLLGVSRSSVSRLERDPRTSFWVNNPNLRLVYRTIRTLSRDFVEGRQRPWFTSHCPDLDDRIPLSVAAEGNMLAVFAAACAFVGRGNQPYVAVAL